MQWRILLFVAVFLGYLNRFGQIFNFFSLYTALVWTVLFTAVGNCQLHFRGCESFWCVPQKRNNDENFTVGETT